ncbi:MAG: response regulator [Alphaproteobacteria bacterium]
MRILVVEDDFIIASALECRLADAGFTVVGVAASGAEAMAIAECAAPDLAIMDVRLSGGRDGIETAIELASRLGVRSIFVTAHGDAATRARARRARPLGWLEKPYAPDTLIGLILAAFETA